MVNIEKSTDIRIKCYMCGNEYTMNMMRIGPDKKNLMCRNCIDRKPVQKQEPTITQEKKPKQEEQSFKEYFCRECKYNFKRAKHLVVTTCPYCGSSGSLMIKGSTARIIADAAKMKG